MAGRPSKLDKKIREAIYFEPDLLDWIRQQAEEKKTTTSTIINLLVEKEMKQSSV
jgi:hypothetical protein